MTMPNDEEIITVSINLKLTRGLLEKIDTLSKEWGRSRTDAVSDILYQVFADETEDENKN